jgi:hypothetical protein
MRSRECISGVLVTKQAPAPCQLCFFFTFETALTLRLCEEERDIAASGEGDTIVDIGACHGPFMRHVKLQRTLAFVKRCDERRAAPTVQPAYASATASAPAAKRNCPV